MARNGCGQSGQRKFRKAKSFFNDFWVGLAKNERGHLVYETLKSAE